MKFIPFQRPALVTTQVYAHDYLVKVIFCSSAACNVLAVHGSNHSYSALCVTALRKTLLGAGNENTLQDNGKLSVEMFRGCQRSASVF